MHKRGAVQSGRVGFVHDGRSVGFCSESPRQLNTTGLSVTDDTVKVGILHSVTGTMAISETGSVEAEKLAIDQINAMGGVLGRK